MAETNSWQNFANLLVESDERYNSGLFSIKNDPFCATQNPLQLTPDTILAIIDSLYYPAAPYTFSQTEVSFLLKIEFLNLFTYTTSPHKHTCVTGSMEWILHISMALLTIRSRPIMTIYDTSGADVGCGCVMVVGGASLLRNARFKFKMANKLRKNNPKRK